MQTQTEQTPTGRETLDTLKALVITTTHLKIAPAEIRDNANLFDDCGLDSTSVVDLVFGIEEAFGISVPEDEIDAELFQSIKKLAEYIDSKRAANHGAGTQ